MYDDLKIGTGAGIKSFYSKVMNKYLGISREDIRKFLEKQSPYQLTKQEPKIVNKPIITRYPNERWQADLIDVEAYAKDNHNHKYILTIIDNFSKYVFAKGLVKRDAVSILEAFEDIIENQALHTYPKIIQTDNGGEFKNKTFQDWAKLNNIKLKLSLSHTPTSNALIENFNNIFNPKPEPLPPGRLFECIELNYQNRILRSKNILECKKFKIEPTQRGGINNIYTHI